MFIRACLIILVSCATLACGAEDTTRVSVRVYPAEGAMHDSLLTDGSSTFMELVLRGGPVPFTQRYDLNSRSGDLMDIPIGVGYSLEARGYTIDGSGNTNLVFLWCICTFWPGPRCIQSGDRPGRSVRLCRPESSVRLPQSAW